MLDFIYDETKAIEAISYLLKKTKKEKLDILRLVKFLYFAERESLKKYNFPIIGDKYYSLPYGPVVSKTLEQIKNTVSGSKFSEYFKKEGDKIILLHEKKSSSLSEADLEIYDEVYEKFHQYTIAQLIDYCHNSKFVPEWIDPGFSRILIDPEDLLKLLGKTPEEILAIKDMIYESNSIKTSLNKYEA